MQISKSTIIILVVLLAIIALGVIYISGLDEKSAARELASSPATKALSTAAASSSPYTDLDGVPADLDQYLGQVLVVNSWASWSPFSGAELQLLAEAITSYPDDEVVLLAINRGEEVNTAKAYLRTIGVADRVKLILDPDDHYYQTIEGYNMPETVFYDERGAIVAHVRGRLTQAEITAHIEKALTTD